MAERTGGPRTCEHCTHFEPEQSRCERDTVRLVRDETGRRIYVAPRVHQAWSCDSFDLYVFGTEPQRTYEAPTRPSGPQTKAGEAMASVTRRIKHNINKKQTAERNKKRAALKRRQRKLQEDAGQP
jgi:hypothetical protein